MSLYYRFKKWRGHDTEYEITQHYKLIKYTIKHLNGNENEVIANFYKKEGSFATFYKRKEISNFMSGHDIIWTDNEKLRTLEGIEEIEEEIVGVTEAGIRWDMAEHGRNYVDLDNTEHYIEHINY